MYTSYMYCIEVYICIEIGVEPNIKVSLQFDGAKVIKLSSSPLCLLSCMYAIIKYNLLTKGNKT
jgi:hypothetical protein